jgi:hypothetical protein
LYNGTLPTAMQNRVIAAYATLAGPGATTAQIATVMLEQLLADVVRTVKRAEAASAVAANEADIDAQLKPLP